MKREYYLLIPNKDRSRLWLVKDNGHWALPQVEIPESFWWQDVVPINRAAQSRLGCAVTTLGCLPITVDITHDIVRFIYALELQGPLPESGSWIKQPELEADNFPWPEGYELVQAWLTQPPPIPWYHAGWREIFRPWAEGALVSQGLTLTAPVEQLRSWERSSLWRLTTTRESFYFKAISPTFEYEPLLTQALAEWYPNWVAPVLASNPPTGWMLLGDAGHQSLLREPDAQHWAEALRSYGELQVAASERVADLLALGIPDRRIQHLPDWIASLLADTAALRHSEAGLSEAEIERLRAQLPAVLAACKTLAACPVPATLEHGDFAPGQVVFSEDHRYRFIDWSDASVSFPFFSMLFYWSELGENFTNSDEVRIRLRDAYLEPWTACAPISELRELYAAAIVVAPFYYALIYYRHILPAMAVQWEMERMLPYYLRLALKD